jgi:flagellar protein FlaG
MDSAEAGEEARVARAAVAHANESAVRTKTPPREDVREVTARIAERIDKYLKDSGRNVEYRVDAAAGATVITVRRADSGEVVRQFPSEEALAWLQRLNEQSGTFLDALA